MDGDFGPVIAKALASGEFEENPGQVITVGFGHDAVLIVAPQVIDAVKAAASATSSSSAVVTAPSPDATTTPDFCRACPPRTAS